MASVSLSLSVMSLTSSTLFSEVSSRYSFQSSGLTAVLAEALSSVTAVSCMSLLSETRKRAVYSSALISSERKITVPPDRVTASR